MCLLKCPKRGPYAPETTGLHAEHAACLVPQSIAHRAQGCDGLVEAHRGRELRRQCRARGQVADPERLLDAGQPEVVDRAEHVEPSLSAEAPIGVSLERSRRERPPHRTESLECPTGVDLDPQPARSGVDGRLGLDHERTHRSILWDTAEGAIGHAHGIDVEPPSQRQALASQLGIQNRHLEPGSRHPIDPGVTPEDPDRMTRRAVPPPSAGRLEEPRDPLVSQGAQDGIKRGVGADHLVHRSDLAEPLGVGSTDPDEPDAPVPMMVQSCSDGRDHLCMSDEHVDRFEPPDGLEAHRYHEGLARMAESADATDSKSVVLSGVRVRVPLRAPSTFTRSAAGGSGSPASPHGSTPTLRGPARRRSRPPRHPPRPGSPPSGR